MPASGPTWPRAALLALLLVTGCHATGPASDPSQTATPPSSAASDPPDPEAPGPASRLHELRAPVHHLGAM
jgi:hypothetical protein